MRKSLPRFSIPRPAALSNYDDDDDDDDDDDGDDDDDDDDDDEPPRGPLVFTSWRPQQVFICAGLPRRALMGSILYGIGAVVSPWWPRALAAPWGHRWCGASRGLFRFREGGKLGT